MQHEEAPLIDKEVHDSSAECVIRYGRLTEREKEVMTLVARGFTAPEIGGMLVISPKTVDTYKQRICEKMSIQHRSDYVSIALKLGLLS